MEAIKRHHLCDECLEKRIAGKWDISPNLWCMHEYNKMQDMHKNSQKHITKMLKEKSVAILNMRENKK